MVERTYGLTAEQYDALLARQGGRCAICRARPKSKRLAVDHDHATGEVTIAGAKEERDCDRLEWELANATGVAPAKTAGDAWPETVRREYERDQLAARLRRARPFLGDEVETLKLCQVLLVPIPEVEALDVYRALPRREGDAVGYYLDFVETQMAPAMAVFGTSGTFIWQGGLGQGGPDAPPLDETLHAQLPRPELTGEPSLKAVKLINKLEKFSRQMLGGVVGYSAAGGLGQWALIDRPVYVHGHNLVVPRVVAGLFMVPILTIFFDVIGMTGAWLVCTKLLGLDSGVFLDRMRWIVDWKDVNLGLTKAAVFGVTVCLIACRQGFYAKGGAAGVGQATNRSVVHNAIAILLLDYLVTGIVLGEGLG